jgi:hypothetical protein
VTETLYAKYRFNFRHFYANVKDPEWPTCESIDDFDSLPLHIQKECTEVHQLTDFIKRLDNTRIEKGRVVVPHLEWHAAHACNFTCESCSHLSNHGHTDLISVDQLRDWFAPWVDKVIPMNMAVLGGEPLLNRNILDIIRLSREMWDTVPGQVFTLDTNGWLLDRHPDLPKVLADTDCMLAITHHGPAGEKYENKMLSVIELAQRWQKEYGIKYKLTKFDFLSETNSRHSGSWQKTFNGFGEHMRPYDDGDPESSWHNCPTGQDCFQLFDGKIYKCAPLTYLPLVAARYKLSSQWDPYLAYEPLQPGSTLEDIRWFYNRGAESVCGMCPSKPGYFIKRDPLTPLTFYKKNTDSSAMPR